MVDFQPFPIGCKATLILGIVTTLICVAGRRWPQFCTAWKRVGIVALLVLPFAVWTFPAIGIPVLPAPAIVAAPACDTALAVQVERPATRPHVQISVVQPSSDLDWQAMLAAIDKSPTLLPTKPIDEPLTEDKQRVIKPDPMASPRVDHDSTQLSPSLSFSVQRALPISSTQTTNPQQLIVGFVVAYGLILMTLVVRLIGACRGLDQLKRTSVVVVDLTWLKLMMHWSAKMGIRRPVELRASDEVKVPMTFGWRSPMILVPREFVIDCDAIQREAILIHELTHISRGDFFWQILVQLTTSLYWLHPLAWFVRRESEALRERLCDRLCSRQLGQEAYALALVQIAARLMHTRHAGIGIAMAQRSSLKRRLNDLSQSSNERVERSGRVTQLLVVGTAICTLGLIVVGMLTRRIPTEETEHRVKTIAVAKEETNDLEAAVDAVADNPPSTKTSADGDEWDDDDFGGRAKHTSVKTIEPVTLAQIMTGYVMDRSGAALPNATVTLSIRKTDDLFNEENPTSATMIWTTTSETDGSYKIETGEQTLGSYDTLSLQAAAEGYLPATTQVERYAATMGYMPSQELFARQGGTVPQSRLAGKDGAIGLVKEVDWQQIASEWVDDVDDTEEFNAQVAATVNGEPILNGTILNQWTIWLRGQRKTMIDQANNQNGNYVLHQLPSFENFQKLRRSVISSNIAQFVQTKLLEQRLLAQLNSEQVVQVKENVEREFEKRIRELKNVHNVSTLEELESTLQDKGTTLQNVKDNYITQAFAQECVKLMCPPPEISETEMVEYYQTHAAEYKTVASVDWQKISIDISPSADRIDARKKLEELLIRLNRGESAEQVVGQSDRQNKPRPQFQHRSEAGTENYIPNDGFLRDGSPTPKNVRVGEVTQASDFKAVGKGIDLIGLQTAPTVIDPQGTAIVTFSDNTTVTVNSQNTPVLNQFPFPADYIDLSNSSVRFVANLNFDGTGASFSKIAVPIKKKGEKIISKAGGSYYFGADGEMVPMEPAVVPPNSEPVLRSYQQMSKGSLVDVDLETQVFSIELNRWSNIIDRHDSCCVIFVSNRKPTELKPFDDVKESIRKQLFKERQTAKFQAFIAEVYATAKIESEYDIRRLNVAE